MCLEGFLKKQDTRILSEEGTPGQTRRQTQGLPGDRCLAFVSSGWGEGSIKPKREQARGKDKVPNDSELGTTCE